jgi:protein XRP2
VILLPSKDDDDTMKGMREALDETPYGAKSVIEKFADMHHGFVAARADYSVPEQAAAATKAIKMMADFFAKNCASCQ